jgi:hypothetical protein
MNDFDGNEYEIRHASGLRTPINLALTNKMNISAFPVLTYEGSFHPLYQQDHPNSKGHRCFSVDFNGFNVK